MTYSCIYNYDNFDSNSKEWSTTHFALDIATCTTTITVGKMFFKDKKSQRVPNNVLLFVTNQWCIAVKDLINNQTCKIRIGKFKWIKKWFGSGSEESTKVNENDSIRGT